MTPAVWLVVNQAHNVKEKKSLFLLIERKDKSFAAFPSALGFPKGFQMALLWFGLGWAQFSAALGKTGAAETESSSPIPYTAGPDSHLFAQKPTDIMPKVT